jgi:drug/metabolite transporter (DMT)-like permease
MHFMAHHNERLRADLTLLAAAAVWGSSFVVQRLAAAHLGFFTFNGLRFLLGALTLLPLTGTARTTAARRNTITRTEWRGGMLAGLLLVVASALQQAGVQFTTAGKAGFITVLYVVLVPLFLALGWREWPNGFVWAASLLALVGMFLLSIEEEMALSLGDGLELAGAACWALHVILIGRLAARADTLRLAIIQYLVCGVLSTALGLAFEFYNLAGLVVGWWAVIYGGVLSVGLGFTLQVFGQKTAPAADAALILSMEAVFAALFGWLLLGETLTAQQILGCGLMLGGMLLAQVPTFKRAKAARIVTTQSTQ